MSVDVMIVGPAEDIARAKSFEIMAWLNERWQEFEIPYGYIQLDEADISDLRSRFSDDPVGQILLKKIQAAKTYVKGRGHELDLPFTVELMISH